MFNIVGKIRLCGSPHTTFGLSGVGGGTNQFAPVLSEAVPERRVQDVVFNVRLRTDEQSWVGPRLSPSCEPRIERQSNVLQVPSFVCR